VRFCASRLHLSPSVDGRMQWEDPGSGVEYQATPDRVKAGGGGVIGDEDDREKGGYFA